MHVVQDACALNSLLCAVLSCWSVGHVPVRRGNGDSPKVRLPPRFIAALSLFLFTLTPPHNLPFFCSLLSKCREHMYFDFLKIFN